jgi:hypothetical protein
MQPIATEVPILDPNVRIYERITRRIFATQSYLSLIAPMRCHVTSLHHKSTLITSLQCGNLDLSCSHERAHFTHHIAQISWSSWVTTWIRTVSGFPSSLLSITLYSSNSRKALNWHIWIFCSYIPYYRVESLFAFMLYWCRVPLANFLFSFHQL